jgi:hypothetical protein
VDECQEMEGIGPPFVPLAAAYIDDLFRARDQARGAYTMVLLTLKELQLRQGVSVVGRVEKCSHKSTRFPNPDWPASASRSFGPRSKILLQDPQDMELKPRSPVVSKDVELLRLLQKQESAL